MESDKIKVEKLKDQENWPQWKFQVKIILENRDAYEVLTGELTKPDDLPNEPTAAQVTNHTNKLAAWKKAELPKNT